MTLFLKTIDLFNCCRLIIEHFKSLHITDFLNLLTKIIYFNILYNFQYGFWSKQTTQHAILDILKTIYGNMDSRKYRRGILIDLKKAFDTVNRSILLAKLENYAIRAILVHGVTAKKHRSNDCWSYKNVHCAWFSFGTPENMKTFYFLKPSAFQSHS